MERRRLDGVSGFRSACDLGAVRDGLYLDTLRAESAPGKVAAFLEFGVAWRARNEKQDRA